MASLRSRGAQLAIAVAGALVLAVGLAAGGAFSGCSRSSSGGGRPSQAVTSAPYGAVAHVTAKVFARETGPRAADTWGEIEAREFIAGAFQQYSYFPLTKEFIVTKAGQRTHSANVIAVKEGESSWRLIVGAHYDSASGRQGYLDNATGIGLLLEVAARIKHESTPYTIVFVAFGAEESGMLGSDYYERTMTDIERRATLGMIDLDAVAGGDQLSVTGRFGGATWLRDDIMAAAKSLDVPLVTSPAAKGRDAGTSIALSDDLPFAEADIPTALLTSVDWEHSGSSRLVATAKDGRIWHTAKDTVNHVEKAYPGRVEGQLSDLSRLLETVLTSELEGHQ